MTHSKPRTHHIVAVFAAVGLSAVLGTTGQRPFDEEVEPKTDDADPTDTRHCAAEVRRPRPAHPSRGWVVCSAPVHRRHDSTPAVVRRTT